MNIKKITISIIIVLLLSSVIFTPKTFAISNILKQGQDFEEDGKAQPTVINKLQVRSVSTTIYNILLACGIAVAVIVGAILGITFILSSAEGKAKISETLVPYIVGCFVVFGAFTIWKIAINAGNNISTTSTTFTTASDGKMYCDSCGYEVTQEDIHNGECSHCRKSRDTQTSTQTSTVIITTPDGKKYCDSCGDVIGRLEENRGQCMSCGKSIKPGNS